MPPIIESAMHIAISGLVIGWYSDVHFPNGSKKRMLGMLTSCAMLVTSLILSLSAAFFGVY